MINLEVIVHIEWPFNENCLACAHHGEFTNPAFPHGLMSAAPDMMKPEYVALHQKLESMGIEMCPDKLHLCPATADCCKKDGKWDCCPKPAAIEAQCCIQSGFKRVCCIGNIPRCRWDGCYFG
ncbi:GRANULINS domain-containing protein [Caerostris darwini]|uniref:GRANULINS domain-containing protein n=1 Tax=Caerostris darwini TaxID=1538125 RepID=A0AAV4S5L9_9ARAC|nr:GRANULINS domain-containing protein [Caerostris darwini]